MPQLPDELLLKIFESMNDWESGKEMDEVDMKTPFYLPRASLREKYSTLFNIALMSKHFRELVEPFLYATYAKNTNIIEVPRPPDPCAFNSGRWERDPYQRSFLATIIRTPDLAMKVTSLKLGGSENHWGLKRRGVFPDRPFKEFRRLLLWRFRGRFFTTFKDIIEAVLDGSEDAETALILALTPKVTSLEYHMPADDTYDPRIQFQIPLMTEKALGSDLSISEGIMLQGLKALERLSIQKVPGKANIDMNHFAHVHLLPNLKHLELVDFWDTRDDSALSTPDVGRSTVETLLLSRCKMDVPAIQTLLASCSHLRSFHLEMLQPRHLGRLVRVGHRLPPSSIISCTTQRDSLVNLYLSSSSTCHLQDPEPSLFPP
ncbi:hypothetical protein BDV97DRAFT_403076 [Delphinella strobiligena]|nr:hypothetical protein BDV97DRAFT_403076 [Delphinella strobiligena]